MMKTEHCGITEKTHFRDYVCGLPHQWIFDHLIAGVGGARRILSSAMIREAAAKFSAGASLAARFEGLPPELRLRCAQVYLMGGGGLGLGDPSACAREPLLASLLVFAAQDAEGGARLFGFGEFEPELRSLAAQALAGAGVTGDCAQPPAAGCPWRPLNDVAAFCSLAAQGQLTRSAHGGLSRSAINTLRRLVHDPTMSGRSNPDGAGHPAGFLTGYCLEEGLVFDAGARYCVNRQKFAAWANRSVKERLGGLMGYATEFLGGLGLGLALELLRRCEGKWLSVNALAPEPERGVVERAACVLAFLGYAHVGSHTSGGARFTPCKPADGVDEALAGEPGRGTVVMSDFSVVIPQEASPSELFEFSNIGTLCEFDKVYKGRITKESVSGALSAGVDADGLRGWLRGRGASANVAKTVDEWIREFSRLFVCRGAALITSDEKVTRQIASLEPLRKHIVALDAHAVFAIRPGSEQKALDILQKLGFDARMPGAESEADAAKLKAPPAGDGEGGSRDGDAAVPAHKRRWQPITDFSPAPVEAPPPPMRWTKYSEELKPLEIGEMIQVVDYALLTGNALTIDYDGSASVTRDIYKVMPLSIDKGLDAAIEAEIPSARGSKRFYLSRIKRIGVVTL